MGSRTAVLLVGCGLLMAPRSTDAEAQPFFKLVRTELTKHIAGQQPQTTKEPGGKKAFELVTNEANFMSRANVNIVVPDRIANDQEKFSASARLECTWSLKSTVTNVGVGLIVLGVPKSNGKGDPGPWLAAGSHTLDVEVKVETTLATAFGAPKWTENGKNYRSLSMEGHSGVGQTLSGFKVIFVYEQTTETEPQPGKVEVLEVVGEAEISPGGDDSKMKALRPGDRINEFDRLTTGMDSKVKLRFPDGSVVEVGELTDMKVACYNDAGNAVQTRLWLRGGEVSASVNKSSERPSDFAVKTPTATAGVRGTRFTVRHMTRPHEQTTIRVTEGRVEVGATDPFLKPVVLSAGQSVNVSLERIGPVRDS